MRSRNSHIEKAAIGRTDVERLLSAVLPQQEMSYQEHRRAVECQDAVARWPLLADVADSLSHLSPQKSS